MLQLNFFVHNGRKTTLQKLKIDRRATERHIWRAGVIWGGAMGVEASAQKNLQTFRTILEKKIKNLPVRPTFVWEEECGLRREARCKKATV